MRRGSGSLSGPLESGQHRSGRPQVRPHPGPLSSSRRKRNWSLTQKIDHPIRRTRRVPRQGPPASRHRGTYCDSEGIGRSPFGCSGWPSRATWGHINRGQSTGQGAMVLASGKFDRSRRWLPVAWDGGRFAPRPLTSLIAWLLVLSQPAMYGGSPNSGVIGARRIRILLCCSMEGGSVLICRRATVDRNRPGIAMNGGGAAALR